jgi:hypothetical protein
VSSRRQKGRAGVRPFNLSAGLTIDQAPYHRCQVLSFATRGLRQFATGSCRLRLGWAPKWARAGAAFYRREKSGWLRQTIT